MNEVSEIIQTIKALRDEDTGCPWDREQTLKSLIKPLKDETEEFIEAVASGNKSHIAEELGDIIWNSLMLLEVASEEGIADKASVLNYVNSKMISRHPHVFGSETASSKEEALKVYEQAKAEHRKNADNV